MGHDLGASVPDQALAVPATPANAVDGPSGFDPSRIERPSAHGAILGEALSDLAKAGAVGGPLLDMMCATCAFREGCMTNQMAATGLTALNCVLGVDPDGFACHHGMRGGQPTKDCAGFHAAKRAPFPVVKAVLATMKARLAKQSGPDEIRAKFDAWAATADPENRMDNYERSRRYSKAIATEAQRAETVKLGSVHEGAGPQDIAQGQGS